MENDNSLLRALLMNNGIYYFADEKNAGADYHGATQDRELGEKHPLVGRPHPD